MGKIIFYNELDTSQELASLDTKPINLRSGQSKQESPYGYIETKRINITEGYRSEHFQPIYFDWFTLIEIFYNVILLKRSVMKNLSRTIIHIYLNNNV